MNDSNIASIYLIGIGGAAMAPLAGMLAERDYTVTGSDTGVYPPASTLLEKLGITWKNGFRETNLAPRPDLVVIGNAGSEYGVRGYISAYDATSAASVVASGT